MGTIDADGGDFSTLFSRLTSIDTDVFGEIRHGDEGMMSSSMSQLMADAGRRQPTRPQLRNVLSLPESSYRLTRQQSFDILLSPEPRFHSDPGRLEDILSSLHISQNMKNFQMQQQQQQQQPQSLYLTRSGTTHQQPSGMHSAEPDRRTISLGDVCNFASSTGDEHRQLTDAVLAGWDVGAGALSAADAAQQQQSAPQRYKTELCRPFEEHGTCRYGNKCQFAHGRAELRNVSRHPKYKTEMCRTFHTTGYCPYGPRCHFKHNDESQCTDRRPTSQHHQQQQQPLPRQMSTPGAAIEHAAVIQRDIERQRAQRMQPHVLLSRRRATIDESPFDLVELAASTAEWVPPAESVVDRRRASCGTGLPMTMQSSGWLPMTSPLSSSSSASSPISCSSIPDHRMSYVMEPPPGLPAPGGVDVRMAVGGSRSPPRSLGGVSPTYDETSPAVTPVMFNQMGTTGVPQVRHTSPVGRQPMFPASFYTAAAEVPVSAAVHQHHHQQGPMPEVESTVRGAAEVNAWLSGTVGDRRAAFSAASTWASGASTARSFDETSSGCSSFSDDDEADLRQKVASLSLDQFATLIELVKTCAPKSVVRPTPDVTSVPVPRLERSLSFAEPSSTSMTSYRADHLQWLHQQGMNAATIYPATVAPSRAAGVCG